MNECQNVYNSDNSLLRKEAWSKRSCELCNLFEIEDAKHLIIRCTRLDDLRHQMFTAINESCNGTDRHVLDNTDDLFAICYSEGIIIYTMMR